MRRFAGFYGAHPLHLLTMMCCFALWLSVIVVAGPQTFINTHVWWQSIAVWFVGAAVLHDMLLFPLYALADLSLRTGLRAMRGADPQAHRSPDRKLCPAARVGHWPDVPHVFSWHHDREGIFYYNATGMTEDPFLHRWLLLVAAMLGLGQGHDFAWTARPPTRTAHAHDQPSA